MLHGPPVRVLSFPSDALLNSSSRRRCSVSCPAKVHDAVADNRVDGVKRTGLHVGHMNLQREHTGVCFCNADALMSVLQGPDCARQISERSFSVASILQVAGLQGSCLVRADQRTRREPDGTDRLHVLGTRHCDGPGGRVTLIRYCLSVQGLSPS